MRARKGFYSPVDNRRKKNAETHSDNCEPPLSSTAAKRAACMPSYQQTIAAKERAKRIRETRDSVRERLARQEDAATIRNVLKFGAESEAA